jgi:ABC-type phosphate/phosphonate transport system permease subunit
MANIIYKLNVASVSMQLQDNAPKIKNQTPKKNYCTLTINILIIFFTQIFQGKISDLLVRISPFNQGYKVQSFFKFSFSSMDKMNEKTNLWAIFSNWMRWGEKDFPN